MQITIIANLSEDQLRQIALHIIEMGLVEKLMKPKTREEELGEQLLSIKQVSIITGVSDQTIRSHIKSGLLQSNKAGKSIRISRLALNKYINNE